MSRGAGSGSLAAEDLRGCPPSPDRPGAAKGMKEIAIVEICTIINFDVLGCVAGILTLVFMSDEEVKRYLAGLEGSAPAAQA